MDGTFMLTSFLIVGHHSRRSVPNSTTCLLPYPHNPLSSNSFPHNLLSDPHPLNPAVSIFYKNIGGRGVLFLVIPSEARDLLFPYFFTSLFPYFQIRKAQRCPPNSALQLAPPSIPTASTSAPKVTAVTC